MLRIYVIKSMQLILAGERARVMQQPLLLLSLSVADITGETRTLLVEMTEEKLAQTLDDFSAIQKVGKFAPF